MTAIVSPSWRLARGADRPRVALAVWVVAGVMVLALLLVAGRYGFHGDEFYFVVTGRHSSGGRAGQSDAGAVPGGRLVRVGGRPAVGIPSFAGVGGGWVCAARGLLAREF